MNFLQLDSLAFWHARLIRGACPTINASALKWHGYFWLDGYKGKSQTNIKKQNKALYKKTPRIMMDMSRYSIFIQIQQTHESYSVWSKTVIVWLNSILQLSKGWCFKNEMAWCVMIYNSHGDVCMQCYVYTVHCLAKEMSRTCALHSNTFLSWCIHHSGIGSIIWTHQTT